MEKNDLPYNGDISHYEPLYAWASDVCTQTVREITFENAEVSETLWSWLKKFFLTLKKKCQFKFKKKELTEEGLPFLILFHRAEDKESVTLFEQEVKNQLAHVKSK